MSVPLEKLVCSSLEIGYEGRAIRPALNFESQAGELTCLLGSNGCGKSTLFKTMMGALPAISGTWALGDMPLGGLDPVARAKILATVFTRHTFPEYMSGLEVVLSGRYPHLGPWKSPRPEDHACAERCMEMVGAEHLAKRWVKELSDGETQRLVIARALAQNPKVLILDEPTAYLDVPHKAITFKVLRRWAKEQGAHVLISTHDLDFALSFSDHIWLMGQDQQWQGLPEDLLMQGVLSQVFQGGGVRFNEQGQLDLREEASRSIDVQVDSGQRLLVERSLNRLGFAHRSGADLRLYREGAEWVLDDSAQAQRRFDALQDLVRALD